MIYFRILVLFLFSCLSVLGQKAATVDSNGHFINPSANVIINANGLATTNSTVATITGTTNQINTNTNSGTVTISLTPTIHIQTGIDVGGSGLQFGDGGISGTTYGAFYAISNGLFRLLDSSGGGTPSIILGSQSNTSVLFKGNGTTFSLRLGDNSGDGNLSAGNGTLSGSLTIGGTLGYTDTGIAATAIGNTNSYYQIILQNTSTGTLASSDLILNNNLSTASTYYGDLGMNSSNFSGTGSFNLPNATYLYAANGDLVIGTYTANGIHFTVNNASTDAIFISSTGTVTIPTISGTTNYGTLSGTAINVVNLITSGTTTLAGTTTVTGSLIAVFMQRSGTSTSSLVLQNGEGYWNTTKHDYYIGDGVTLGGILIAGPDYMIPNNLGVGTSMFTITTGTFLFGGALDGYAGNITTASITSTGTVPVQIGGITIRAGASTTVTGTGTGGNLTVSAGNAQSASTGKRIPGNLMLEAGIAGGSGTSSDNNGTVDVGSLNGSLVTLSFCIDNGIFPNITAGPGVGSTGSISEEGANNPNVGISYQSGMITVTVSGTIATGTICTFDTNGNFGSNSKITAPTGYILDLFPANASAAALTGTTMVYATHTATSVLIHSGTAALPVGTYQWTYQIRGF